MSNREAAAASERPLAVFGPDRATPFAGWEITARYATPEEAARAKALLTAASAPQAVRMLTEVEASEVTRFAARGSAIRRDGGTSLRVAEAIQRKFCEVNGIVPLAPQDSTKEGT